MSLEHLKGYFRLGPPSMRPSRRPMSGGHWHGHMAFLSTILLCAALANQKTAQRRRWVQSSTSWSSCQGRPPGHAQDTTRLQLLKDDRKILGKSTCFTNCRVSQHYIFDLTCERSNFAGHPSTPGSKITKPPSHYRTALSPLEKGPHLAPNPTPNGMAKAKMTCRSVYQFEKLWSLFRVLSPKQCGNTCHVITVTLIFNHW